MNCNRICQLQFIQLCKIIVYKTVVFKPHQHLFRKEVDVFYHTGISVKNAVAAVIGNAVAAFALPFQLIVIFYLHDLIAHAVNGIPDFFFHFVCGRRI